MDFNSFPAQWEWVALIIGGVAFLMAVQPFLQMIYGRPRIVIILGNPKVINGSTMLECHIFNRPITKRILNALCITRHTATGLIALFHIEESRTGDRVYEEWPHLYSQAGDATQRVDLPVGYVPARFAVVTIDEATGKVYAGLVGPTKRQDVEALADGLYEVTISVEVGGKVVRNMKKNLTVQTKCPYAYWVSSR